MEQASVAFKYGWTTRAVATVVLGLSLSACGDGAPAEVDATGTDRGSGHLAETYEASQNPLVSVARGSGGVTAMSRDQAIATALAGPGGRMQLDVDHGADSTDPPPHRAELMSGDAVADLLDDVISPPSDPDGLLWVVSVRAPVILTGGPVQLEGDDARVERYDSYSVIFDATSGRTIYRGTGSLLDVSDVG